MSSRAPAMRAGGGRGALDLGDEMEPRRHEAFDDPARRRCAGQGPGSERALAAEALLEVRPAARRDLLDDVRGPGLRSRPRRGRGGRRSGGRGHAVTPLVSAARRSARRRSSISRPRPASMVRAARSIPSSIDPTRSATSSAAAALRTTTSRRAPGSPRSTDSIIRAFSSAVPPASLVVGTTLKPSFDAGIWCRSTPDGLT